MTEDSRRADISRPDGPAAAGLPEGDVDAAIRQALLRAMTDLYIAKIGHTESEERQFTELALRLIDLVDDETREAVAAKLLRYEKVPPEIRARLTAGGPDAPEEAMPDPQTFALRRDDADTADPRETDPRETWRSAARDLDDLFFSADAFERRLILFALDAATIRPAAVTPADAATVAALERAALERDADTFSRILERTLGISSEAARRIVGDDTGELVLVAALALGLSEAVVQRVLLCLNPSIAQSVQRIYDLAALHREVGPQSARRLIAIWRAAHPADEASRQRRPAPAHQPASSRTLPQDRAEARAADARAPQAQPSEGRPAEGRPALPARPTIRWDEISKRAAEN